MPNLPPLEPVTRTLPPLESVVSERPVLEPVPAGLPALEPVTGEPTTPGDQSLGELTEPLDKKNWRTAFQELRAAPVKYTPFLGMASDLYSTARTFHDSWAVKDGTATPEQTARLDNFLQDRQRESTWSYKVWDQILKLPAFAVEFMTGGAVIKGAAKMGLIKAGTKLAEAAGGTAVASKIAAEAALKLRSAPGVMGAAERLGAATIGRALPTTVEGSAGNRVLQYLSGDLTEGVTVSTGKWLAAKTLAEQAAAGQTTAMEESVAARVALEAAMGTPGEAAAKKVAADAAAKVAAAYTERTVQEAAIAAGGKQTLKEVGKLWAAAPLVGLTYATLPIGGMGLKVAKETWEYMTPSYGLDKDQYGEWERHLMNDGDDFGVAFAKAFGGTAIEAGGMDLGASLGLIRGAFGGESLKVLKAAVVSTAIGKYAAEHGGKEAAKFAGDWTFGANGKPGALARLGWTGWFGGMFAQGVIGAAKEVTGITPIGLPTMEDVAAMGVAFAFNPMALVTYANDKRHEAVQAHFEKFQDAVLPLVQARQIGQPVSVEESGPAFQAFRDYITAQKQWSSVPANAGPGARMMDWAVRKLVRRPAARIEEEAVRRWTGNALADYAEYARPEDVTPEALQILLTRTMSTWEGEGRDRDIVTPVLLVETKSQRELARKAQEVVPEEQQRAIRQFAGIHLLYDPKASTDDFWDVVLDNPDVAQSIRSPSERSAIRGLMTIPAGDPKFLSTSWETLDARARKAIVVMSGSKAASEQDRYFDGEKAFKRWQELVKSLPKGTKLTFTTRGLILGTAEEFAGAGTPITEGTAALKHPDTGKSLERDGKPLYLMRDNASLSADKTEIRIAVDAPVHSQVEELLHLYVGAVKKRNPEAFRELVMGLANDVRAELAKLPEETLKANANLRFLRDSLGADLAVPINEGIADELFTKYVKLQRLGYRNAKLTAQDSFLIDPMVERVFQRAITGTDHKPVGGSLDPKLDKYFKQAPGALDLLRSMVEPSGRGTHVTWSPEVERAPRPAATVEIADVEPQQPRLVPVKAEPVDRTQFATYNSMLETVDKLAEGDKAEIKDMLNRALDLMAAKTVDPLAFKAALAEGFKDEPQLAGSVDAFVAGLKEISDWEKKSRKERAATGEEVTGAAKDLAKVASSVEEPAPAAKVEEKPAPAAKVEEKPVPVSAAEPSMTPEGKLVDEVVPAPPKKELITLPEVKAAPAAETPLVKRVTPKPVVTVKAQKSVARQYEAAQAKVESLMGKQRTLKERGRSTKKVGRELEAAIAYRNKLKERLGQNAPKEETTKLEPTPAAPRKPVLPKEEQLAKRAELAEKAVDFILKKPTTERKSAEELVSIDKAQLEAAGFKDEAALDEAHAKEGLHEYGETKKEFLERKYCQGRAISDIIL